MNFINLKIKRSLNVRFFVSITLSLFFSQSFFYSSTLYAREQKSFYSESADVFEIMDQLSRWNPSIDNTVEKAWTNHFGELFNDKNFLDDYRALRRKYYKYVKSSESEKNIFSSFSLGNNYFSESFYSSQSIGQALKKLKRILKPKEIAFLAKFYTHFLKNISYFAKQSTFFRSQTKSYNKKMKKLKARGILNQAKRFILQHSRIKDARILFVWWPKDKNSSIEVRGRNILVRIHPEATEKYPLPQQLFLFQIRTYLANLSETTKRNLNHVFFKNCKPKHISGTALFEIPFALAIGEMQIAAKKDRRDFQFVNNWSVDPWVTTYAKLLYTEVSLAIKRRDNIEGDFIKNASKLCQELVTIGEFYSSFKK